MSLIQTRSRLSLLTNKVNEVSSKWLNCRSPFLSDISLPAKRLPWVGSIDYILPNVRPSLPSTAQYDC